MGLSPVCLHCSPRGFLSLESLLYCGVVCVVCVCGVCGVYVWCVVCVVYVVCVPGILCGVVYVVCVHTVCTLDQGTNRPPNIVWHNINIGTAR